MDAYRQRTKEQLAFLAEVLGRIKFSEDGQVGWIVISKELEQKTGTTPATRRSTSINVKSIKGVRVAVYAEGETGRARSR